MDFINGFDLSSLPEVEQCGGRFFDNGREDSALNILSRYGANYLRIRLWNDPYTAGGEDYGAGICDLPAVLRLAHRAKLAGMDWLLDLHYSDFWADPGKQVLPKAWQHMTLEELEQAVYQYTLDVLHACRAANVTPGMVQVGNEVTNGILWPFGKVPNWDNLTRLLNAGARAVRDFDPNLPVMIHLDNGSNKDLYRNWFDNYFTRGGICDIIGLSYYPLWHGTMQGLEENLQMLANRYHKPMIVVETSCYHTLQDYASYEKLSPEERKGAPMREELKKNLVFPTTPEGQKGFLQEILNILDRVPDGLGQGFFWWEAAWIPVPGSGWAKQGGWEYVHEKGPGGNEWANQTLFDFAGNALPALCAMQEHKR